MVTFWRFGDVFEGDSWIWELGPPGTGASWPLGYLAPADGLPACACDSEQWMPWPAAAFLLFPRLFSRDLIAPGVTLAGVPVTLRLWEEPRQARARGVPTSQAL